ncbi:MAG: hypothetical protein ACE3JP_06000 [Ectobacillus sp.]
MEEFKQKRLPHWEYMWQDKQGRRFVGMVLYPSQRKREGRYLWEMKKRVAEAYKSQDYVPMTILQGDAFLDIDARIWDVKENQITIKDAAGNYYTIRMSEILHIGNRYDEKNR